MHPHSGTDDYHRTSQAYEKGIPVSTSMFQTYTAPVPQKTAQVQPQADLVPWSSGLFDCFNDVGNCCITFWFPCITFGQIAEIVDRGRFSCATSGAIYTLINFLAGYACFYACFYRSKIRSQYSLEKSPCSDCLVHTFCEMCALCQEYRELKFHGFDMSIGWHGNMEKQTPGVRNLQMVAPTQGGMTMSR